MKSSQHDKPQQVSWQQEDLGSKSAHKLLQGSTDKRTDSTTRLDIQCLGPVLKEDRLRMGKASSRQNKDAQSANRPLIQWDLGHKSRQPKPAKAHSDQVARCSQEKVMKGRDDRAENAH